VLFLSILLAGALQSAAPPALSTPQAPSAPLAPQYVPNRVFDTTTGKFVDFEQLLAAIGRDDVVFVGEQHDDPNTHRLEVAVLEGLQRRRLAPIVSLEMFERDVQPELDKYLIGAIAEEELLKASRPWPRYATDYRPLIELAKQSGWTVTAANVPRRIASLVSKSGKDTIAGLSEADRALTARELACPADEYFRRFTESMGSHPSGAQTDDEKRAMTERFYWAQCLKDETMAESITGAWNTRAPGRGPIVHYNGAFHSDFGLGTAERVRRRLPGKRVLVVSVLPVADLDTLAPSGEDLKRADYLLFTVK
jgi:uncharacterized iron-regulated protein